MLNVLAHNDWREVFLFFSGYSSRFQDEMNHARNWDEYVAARTCKAFVDSVVLKLPEIVKGHKEELEREIAFQATGIVDADPAFEEPGA